MAYQSRKRNYKSRRERYLDTRRKFFVTLVIALIAAVVWVIKERLVLWNWLKTYFY